MSAQMSRDAELEVVLARLNKHGEILDEHGRILGEHGDRLNQHDRQHAAQQRWNKRAEKEMRKLAKQLSQEHLGQSDPGAQQNQSEVVEILDSDDDDDEVQDLQAPGSLLSMDLSQEQLDAFAAALATDKLGFVRAPFIRGEDFATLTPGAWLNDRVIII
jgi:Ulp1 family protease